MSTNQAWPPQAVNARAPWPVAWRLHPDNAVRFTAGGEHCDRGKCREPVAIVTWRYWRSAKHGRVLMAEHTVCVEHGREFASRHGVDLGRPQTNPQGGQAQAATAPPKIRKPCAPGRGDQSTGPGTCPDPMEVRTMSDTTEIRYTVAEDALEVLRAIDANGHTHWPAEFQNSATDLKPRREQPPAPSPARRDPDADAWIAYAERKRQECVNLVDGVFNHVVQALDAGETEGAVATVLFMKDEDAGIVHALMNLLIIGEKHVLANCVGPSYSYHRGHLIDRIFEECEAGECIDNLAQVK